MVGSQLVVTEKSPLSKLRAFYPIVDFVNLCYLSRS